MMFLHFISILLLLVCAVCSSDEFQCLKGTQLFQHADGSFECLVCSDCPRGLVKVKNCSLEYDTTCETCDAHNYYHDEEPHCRPCSECLPGEFMRKNCSMFLDTECKPCPKGTFSSHTNSNTCRNCSECQRGSVFNCSRERDTICEDCDAHNYYHDEEPHCRPCTECLPGEFVKKSCSMFLDAECKPCPKGTFSSHTNSNTCRRCSECPRGSVINCSGARNAICELCKYHSYYHDEEPHCRPCTECLPGEIMKKSCSMFLDAECKQCPKGTFSSHTNSKICRNCSECTKGYSSECNSKQNAICKMPDLMSFPLGKLALISIIVVLVVVVVLITTLRYKRRDTQSHCLPVRSRVKMKETERQTSETNINIAAWKDGGIALSQVTINSGSWPDIEELNVTIANRNGSETEEHCVNLLKKPLSDDKEEKDEKYDT